MADAEVNGPRARAQGAAPGEPAGAAGRVVRVPEHTPPPGLAVRGGDELTAVGYDERWPGYVMCGSLDGRSGWLPECGLHYVGPGMAVVRGDYPLTVLPVTAGEQLEVRAEARGWYWAARAGGEAGWVLAEHVQIVDED